MQIQNEGRKKLDIKEKGENSEQAKFGYGIKIRIRIMIWPIKNIVNNLIR